MNKCDICGFECASDKLFVEHMKLHELGKTEKEVIKDIRKKQKENNDKRNRD